MEIVLPTPSRMRIRPDLRGFMQTRRFRTELQASASPRGVALATVVQV